MYLFVNNTEVEFEKNITKALERGGSSMDELRKGAVTSKCHISKYLRISFIRAKNKWGKTHNSAIL